MPSHLLKSTPVETTPPVVVLPPNIVEIELDGEMEQVDIHYEFQVLHAQEAEAAPASTTLFVEEPKVETDPSSTPAKTGKRSNKVLKKGAKEGESSPSSPSRKSNQEQEVRLKLPEPVFRTIDDYLIDDAPSRPNNAYIRYIERTPEELAELVEYDLDELDVSWLELLNEKRSKERLLPVPPEVMEFIMDRLEKESYFQMQSSGIEQGPVIDDDAVCCICMDGECQNANAILFCDMCNLAVHQECYGVPYIPEGQWLCRRCYLSPSIAVDCVLCPNKGGAFKQTECKRWAHVVCAIWIPEVCFANTVFLEPIDNINSIPPARWRLCCFICKQKGVGACIQCYKSNCYIAFHVTCAQQAGLCMRMETVRLSTGVTVKKTAYCDTHAPTDFIAERDNGSPTARQKLKQIRKMLAEKRCAPPIVSVPTITSEQLAQISGAVNVNKKTPFMKSVISYWKLKRMSRNGVPLLRRLQVASNTANSVHKSSRKIDISQSEMKDYAEITRVRQDLEKSRLLCELTRKREKLKRDDIYLRCQEWDMRIQPFHYFLASIVDDMCTRDTQSIFTQPVDPEHVPDYLTVVSSPMDLSTIRKKIFEFEYETIDDLRKDFQLMIDNCLLYNSPDTVFYRSALKMQEFGGISFREAQRRYDLIGFHPSGIMTERPPPEYHSKPSAVDETRLAAEIEEVLEDKSRYNLSIDEHISLLEQALDKSLNLSHHLSRKKKFLRIKNEIVRLKKRKRLLEGGGNVSGGGDISSMDEDEVAPSPSLLGGEIADSSDGGEEGESGAKSFIQSNYSNIRRRLRSTDNESQQLQQIQNQPNRLSRRLSRSSEMMAGISNVSPDIVNMTAGTSNVITHRSPLKSNSLVSQRPRRGRPPKTLSTRGRGAGPRLAVRGAVATLRQQRPLQAPSRGGFRGRPRGRRGLRPLRRSVRVVKQQMMAQVQSPEKEEEPQQLANSRHGSPTGRHSSPRLSRNASPSHQSSPRSNQQISNLPEGRKMQQQRKIPNRQPSPILGSPIKPHQINLVGKPSASHEPNPPNPKPARGRPAKKPVLNLTRAKLKVLSPKTMEAAAKSIICEDRLSSKGKVAVAKGGKLRKLLETNTEDVAELPEKKITRGGATRLAKRNSPRKGTNLTENLNSGSGPRVLPQRKARGPAAAVGKRKKAVSQLNGPLVYAVEAEGNEEDDVDQEGKNNLLPITNGLPLLGSPSKPLVGSPSKQGSPGKKRSRRAAPDSTIAHGANPNTGNYSNSLAGSSLYQPSSSGFHLKKSDSFSVYRSGGDHDINSYSEGESGNDDDEEDDEMEEEEGDEDEDDEEEGELDDDDDSGSEEEPGEPSGPQEDITSDEDEGGGDDDDSSGSDNSSSDDSDSSATTSSSLSSSSSGTTASKASSSSSITTPKHFHPTKNKKRRNSSNIGHKLIHHSTVPLPRQQLLSPTIALSTNNNNNVLCSNKERERDLYQTSYSGQVGRLASRTNSISDEEDSSNNAH